MPEIHSHTAREEYTIAGKSFKVFQPYGAGHVLTANEANALNQVFAENIRNNFASKVKEADEAGTFDQEVLQSKLDEYMHSYEFGVRTGGGGRTTDPVQAEALEIARDLVRNALKKKGHKLADVKAATITSLAKDLIASGKYPQILETAKARVAAASEIADIELGDLNSETEETEGEGEGAGEGSEESAEQHEGGSKRGKRHAEA